jgi:hypothetical protein
LKLADRQLAGLDVPRSHPSLLVDEELARAARQESAAALCFWWGVSDGVVTRWRKALAVGRLKCPGSQRLVRAASAKGADRYRGKRLPPEQVERRRRTARELGLAKHLRPGYNLGPWWSPAELALLGTDDDDVIAARVGRPARDDAAHALPHRFRRVLRPPASGRLVLRLVLRGEAGWGRAIPGGRDERGERPARGRGDPRRGTAAGLRAGAGSGHTGRPEGTILASGLRPRRPAFPLTGGGRGGGMGRGPARRAAARRDTPHQARDTFPDAVPRRKRCL